MSQGCLRICIFEYDSIVPTATVPGIVNVRIANNSSQEKTHGQELQHKCNQKEHTV